MDCTWQVRVREKSEITPRFMASTMGKMEPPVTEMGKMSGGGGGGRFNLNNPTRLPAN